MSTSSYNSHQHNMSCYLDSNFDACQWVINIRRTLEEELDDDDDDVDHQVPVCIFTVPKALMSSHPDSYTPQQLSLGPYHYLRPDLHEMETYKLSAAIRLQNQLQSGHNFQNLVEQLIKLEPKIRACYHKYFNFKAETLAWMMALDVSFLLEFLQIYSLREDECYSGSVSSRMSHLLDYSKRKLAHHVILRDIVMLENQIPTFILRKVLEYLFTSVELADDMLTTMLIGLCKELFPFKMMELGKTKVLEHSHLLDLLYKIIVPNVEQPMEIIIEDEGADHIEAERADMQHLEVDSSNVKQLMNKTWNIVSKLNIGPVRFLKKVSGSVAVKLKLSMTILFKLVRLLGSENCDLIEPEKETSSINQLQPLAEEIAIPSVTQLSKSGVRFVPTKGNISTIKFDTEEVALYLPTISLEANSEIIFRNLVAYEISHASGPMIFTRYVELINGIIDTEEDVRLLRERGIILNHLKSDEAVASLWNGMSRNKCIRLTKVPFLDKVIEDVNKYYDSGWMVKTRKLMKRSVFYSWQYLTLFATILLLLSMAAESFCPFYKCSNILRISDTGEFSTTDGS